MAIIVLQHSDLGGPGRLGMTLRDHGHRLDIRRPDKAGDGAIPADFDNVDGVVALGGPQDVDGDRSRWPWMTREMEFLAEAHARQLPVIGLCLGHQMLAAALGGEIAPMPAPECGFCDLDITPPGQIDPILAGLRWRSPQFQSHAREVAKAPPGASVLASSAKCKVQAMRAGLRTYSFQFHFELDRAGVDAYARHDASTGFLGRAGLNADTVMKQADAQYAVYARLSDRLCVNLATHLMPPGLRVGLGPDMPEGSAAVLNVR